MDCSDDIEMVVQEVETTYMDDQDIHHEIETETLVEELIEEEVVEEDVEEGDVSQMVSSSTSSQRFCWNLNNTKLFIKGYYDRRHRFRDPQVRKIDLWDEIIQEYGFPANLNVITMKWRNLKKTYTMILEKMYDGSHVQYVKWEHFEIFDLLFATDESKIDTGFVEEYFSNLHPVSKTPEDDADTYGLNDNSNNPKFDWTPALVKILIKGFLERRHLFKTPKIKKKDLWREIAGYMGSAGYPMNEEAINSKWRNLKLRYKLLSEKISQGNIGQGVRWEYYDLFKLIFSDDISKIDDNYLDEYFAKLESENEIEDIIQIPRNIDGSIPNFSWCPKSTKLFLKFYLERKERFRDPKIRKKKLWSEIRQEMIMAGYPIDKRETLDKKMRCMKKSYKDLRKTQGTAPITWFYYPLLDEIFGDDPADVNETIDFNQTTETQDGWTTESEVEEKPHCFTEYHDETPYIWCPRSTKFFLKHCLLKKLKFQNPMVNREKLWERILQEMNIAGFPVKSIKVLESKLRSMTKTYKIIKDKNSNNTTGKGFIRWEHFAALEKFNTVEKLPTPPKRIKVERPTSPDRAELKPGDERRRKQASALYHMRKKQLLVEGKKVQLTEQVHETLKETNKLLRERNQLLRKLIDQRKLDEN